MKKISTLIFLASSMMFITCNDDDDSTAVIPPDPIIELSSTSISFGNVEPRAISEVQSVNVSGEDLEGDVTITIPNGFTGSLTEGGTFGSANLTIALADQEAGSVTTYFRAEPGIDVDGPLTGDVTFSSMNADNVTLGLSANVGISITGQLLISEYFDTYGPEYAFLPVDSAMIGWDLNRDTTISASTVGPGWPVDPGPNNEMFSSWYQALPLNGATVQNMCPLTSTTDMTISGYPAPPAGARAIQLDPDDQNNFKFINQNNGNCVGNGDKITRNSGAARRFAPDGYRGNGTTGEVYMSSLVKVQALGEGARPGKANDFGDGDLIFMCSNSTGPANNNNVKILALSDGSGGFNLGILKANEGNTPVMSTSSFDLNTTYLVVISHQFVDGDNNDVTKLYVFEQGDDIPTNNEGLTPVAVMDATYTEGLDPVDLNIAFVRERNQDVVCPKVQITGIRVGDTWVATLFEDATNAIYDNNLPENRIVTDITSDCTL